MDKDDLVVKYTVGQFQPRVIVYITFVGFLSLLLRANLQGHLMIQEKILKGFYHMGARRPSWSCDQDQVYKHSFLRHRCSIENLTSIGPVFSAEMFECMDGVCQLKQKPK